jgi:hypothetical protein
LLVDLPLMPGGVGAVAGDLDDQVGAELHVHAGDAPRPVAMDHLQRGTRQTGATDQREHPSLEPTLPARVDQRVEQRVEQDPIAVHTARVPSDDLGAQALFAHLLEPDRRVDRVLHLAPAEIEQGRIEDQRLGIEAPQPIDEHGEGSVQDARRRGERAGHHDVAVAAWDERLDLVAVESIEPMRACSHAAGEVAPPVEVDRRDGEPPTPRCRRAGDDERSSPCSQQQSACQPGVTQAA